MTATAKQLNENAEVVADIQPLPAWNHRILIVEDEHAIADAYRDILGAMAQTVVPLRRSSRTVAPAGAPSPAPPAVANAFELTVVHDAEKAIAEVKHALKEGHPFTMGFFDVLLGGGMDGIELVKQINELDSNLYAVFVTAYADRGVDAIQSFLGEENASRWDYLNKPFSKGEVLQKARHGVAHWNMRREQQIKDERIAAMQKQLIDNDRLSTVAAVARGIGHEFRNILTLIIGKAELSVHSGEPQLRESMRQILTASNRANEILQRFNYLHSPGEQQVAKKVMHLHQPIEEAVLLMSHQLKSHNVKVCWIRKKPVLVHANATSLVQVFVNLFLNAMHAMGTSGQIDISIVEAGDHAEVRIRDYGPGADAAIVPRLTEAFFTTKGENGTGLGLAIAKEIIETEHDGLLTLANHEVKGFEVTLAFPLLQARSVANEGAG